jgi:hypothetical protein
VIVDPSAYGPGTGVKPKPPKQSGRAFERKIEGNRVVRLEPHKRSEFDRGYYHVLVNGRAWGSIETHWYGVHGTKYFLSDLHGKLWRPGEIVQSGPREGKPRMDYVQARSPDRQQWVREQIGTGKPRAEWGPEPSGYDVMLDLACNAILDNTMRDPDTRNAEVLAEQEERASRMNARDADERECWNTRIDMVLNAGEYTATCERPGIHFEDVDALKEAIRGAMRWAQAR